jgi:chemotaxis protein histidine kinase CheA
MSTQIETLKKRLTLGSLPESAKAAIRKQIEQLENEAMGEQESSTKQQEKLEKEEESKEAEVDDKIEKLKKRLTLGSLPESAKAAIRKQIEDAEKLKSEAKKERAEEKKEAEKKQAEVKAKVKEAVEKVKKVVKEAPKKVSAEKTPAKAKAVEKKVEKEVKKEIEKAKTEVKKAKVEGKKVEAKKAEGAKKRKKKFDKMLTDLQRLINKDKKLKALYGSDSPSNLKRDAGRMAKPFGWRYKGEHNYKVPPKSERGNDNTYYEGRPEKADLRRRTYPYLEMGGDVMGRDRNRFFELAEKLGLVKNGYYIDGIPKGNNEDVNEFYKLEDKLNYPEPQKVYADSGMMAEGGKVREGKFQAMFYTNEDDGYHIDSEYFDVYPSESDIEYLAKSLNSKYVEIYEDRHNDDSYTFLEETYFIDEEYKLGGMFGKSRYNTGRSWHLDHARHNKKEDYEKPMNERKGAKKSSSTAKRAKTGKYSKATKSTSASSSKRPKTGKYAKSSRAESSRGYNYLPNNEIKSITTVDGKVINKKKILDGAYVRKAKGGMMKSPNYDYELFTKTFTTEEQQNILYALTGNGRKKMFGGHPFYLVDIFFSKKEKDDKVDKLKKCGFTVRTVDVSGYPDKGQKYTVWILFDAAEHLRSRKN